MATYYVATTGDNADPGTLAEPWETITYAESQVSAGDTVYIRAGTYDEGEISITENGTPGQDITFRAYGSEEVILQKGAGDDFIFDCTADYRIFQGFELDSEDARSVVRLDGDYDQLLDCDLHDASWWAMVDVGGDHCTVDHCTFLNNYVAVDEDAAGVGCSGGQAYLTVSFCTFENMRGDGIIVDHNTGTPGVDYDGFSFHDNEIFPGAGNQLCCEGGIDVKRGNGECYNNYIHDYRATDQSCGGTGSNGEAIFLHGTDVNSWVVRDNIIENCTIGIWLTSGIEADVYRNVIFDSPAADANADATGNVGVAIYIQDAPSDIDIWNNTFVDCDGKTIWLSDATVDIKNNIFDGCGDYDEDGAPTVTADYNCWNNCSSSTAGGNDVNDDPEFTDRAGDDFTLQSTSPCIDVGTDVGLEYEGTAPDLGAYEYEPPESPAEEAHIIPVGGVGLPDRRKRNLYDSAITYEVWLSDQFGTRIALLDSFERLRWSRVANGVGQVEIVFAPEKFHRDQWWGLDRRLEVWRAPIDGGLRLERIYFLRYLGQPMQGNAKRIVLRGPDANDLLTRRIIDADAGSAGSSKDGTADDVMKEYVEENLGGSAAAGRDITGHGFSIQGDLSAAETVDKGASRRNLLIVLQELAESSRQLGTRLFFDIVHPTPDTFQFQTFTGQRGADRTHGSGQNPIILAPEMGNLQNPNLIQDWRLEGTYGYGAGQGQEENRLVIETSDATRLAASVFNRREFLFDGRIYSSQAGLEDATEARLHELRPIRQFTAELTDSVGFRFGLDWFFGDRMTAEYLGERFDVDTVSVVGTVDGNGNEVIRAALDYAD